MNHNQVCQTEISRSRVLVACRELFVAKLHDYGASWRIMRPKSVTDQIYIKAGRIRTIQEVGARVQEGIEPELVAIINYGIIGIIQLRKGVEDKPTISIDEALQLYDQIAREAFDLMDAKNHDYGEAWRQMRVESIVDLILMKIYRTKQLEDLKGGPKVSEGIDANYFDMINYAIFALIKLGANED